MPIPTTTDIKNTPNSQITNLNLFDPIEEFNFVLQNNSSMDLENLDLNALPKLKLTRQNGGHYGYCTNESGDLGF